MTHTPPSAVRGWVRVLSTCMCTFVRAARVRVRVRAQHRVLVTLSNLAENGVLVRDDALKRSARQALQEGEFDQPPLKAIAAQLGKALQ